MASVFSDSKLAAPVVAAMQLQAGPLVKRKTNKGKTEAK